MSLTELDAVNQVLRACGHRTINSLDGPINPLAAQCLQELRTISRRVQTEGWAWNTDPDRTLGVDAATGTIRVPENTITFQAHDGPQYQIRGGKLFDRAAQTFQFSSAVRGRFVEFLDWEDLPYSAKDYIAAQTARVAYDTQVGGQGEARSSLYRDELAARAILNNEEMELGKYSMLDAPDIPLLRGSSYVPGAMRRDPLL